MPAARTRGGSQKVPAPTRVRRRVEIIGFTESRNAATWDDDTVEKWPVNNLPLFLTPEQHFHRLFDLHDEKTVREDERYVEWLRNATVPVIMLTPFEDFPTSIAFPKAELLDWCKTNGFETYFTNSISYLVALAVMEGVDELGIYGVDMAQGGGGKSGEYAAQRPSCEYWIGVARGRGIKVDVPDTSDLLKSVGLYGFDDDLRPFTKKLSARESELVDRISQIEQVRAQKAAEIDQMDVAMHQLQGALEDVRYIRGVWLMPEGTRKGADPLAESNA